MKNHNRITYFLGVLLCLALSIPVRVTAQPYCNVRTFSLRDGLAANVISSIGQSPDGMMWFGTWNGLCYFDGYQFTSYRDKLANSDILASNRIPSMHPNSNGDVWCISYDKRLFLFDTRLCQYISIDNILKENGRTYQNVSHLFPLKNGYTWAMGDPGCMTCLRLNDKDINGEDGITVLKGFHAEKVILDDFNREWLITDKGLRDKNGKSLTTLPVKHIISSNGKTWLGSANGILLSADKNSSSLRKVKLGFAISHINDMVNYGKGMILLATDRGLVYYNTVSHKAKLNTLTHPMLHSPSVNKIFIDHHKRIWLFTGNDGIVMLRPDGAIEWLQAKAESYANATTAADDFIHEDEYGTIWVVPVGGTFSYYDSTQHKLVAYTLHSEASPLGNLPYIKKHFVDNQNNLWFAGERNLSCVDFRRHHTKIIPTVVNREVRAMLIDRSGNLWTGDHEGTLAVYDVNRKLKGYIAPSGQLQSQPTPFTTRVYSLLQDSKGRMWVGSKESGLYCIDKGSVKHFVKTKDKWSISNNGIYDIVQDKAGRILIATYGGGLNIVDEKNGEIKFINCNNILSQYPKGGFMIVRRINILKDATILSTNGGLVTYQTNFKRTQDLHFFKTIHRRGDSSSLPTSVVLQTLASSKGQVFVNTWGGDVQRIKSENLLQDNLELEELPLRIPDEGLILSMVEDGDGNIWFIRETTVDKYYVRQNKISTFDNHELDYNVEFSEAKPLYNKLNGRILLACNSFVLSFNPKELVKSQFVPKIIFTSVQFQGEETKRSILNTEELEIPSDKRSVTISFAALDYTNNHLIRYAYKLEGSDDDWNYVGREHSAAFNHLPSGHLKLLVRSTNADGEWMDNARTLNIYAHPTFWESWMGWLLYILSAVAIIFIAMYIYAQQQKLKLQSKMSKMRTDFFTNIGHKLRTPLTLIGGPVTEVMKKENLTEKGQEMLDMVRRNSGNMLNLVNNMLSYEEDSDNYLVDDQNAPFAVDGNEVADKQEVGSENTNVDIAPRHPEIKLLVVEDNKDLRQFLFTILSSDYSVITAENGKEGQEKARTTLPDFIITDVMMPVMDGMTMVHELKQDKNTSHIPIIILSAKASMEDRLQGLREGIDDYITKPFSATYLKERISNIIARRHSFQKDMVTQFSSMINKSEAENNAENDSEGKVAEDTKQKVDNTEKVDNYKLKSPEIIDEDKEMMEKLMDYLEKNIGNPNIKVDDMANAVFLGRTVFYGKIKSIVGMSPNDFLRHIRLQRAEELITKSKESISQIAYSVGFADPKYFSKCFRKETGMSPSEYREKKVEG